MNRDTASHEIVTVPSAAPEAEARSRRRSRTSGGTGLEPVTPQLVDLASSGSRRAALPKVVVGTDDKMGQQKVNKAMREHPIRSELIWLNRPLRRVIASGRENPGAHS